MENVSKLSVVGHTSEFATILVCVEEGRLNSRVAFAVIPRFRLLMGEARRAKAKTPAPKSRMPPLRKLIVLLAFPRHWSSP